jgi:hypothetical protein
MLTLARSPRKSSRQAVTQPRVAWAGGGDGDVEAVLPRLVADPAAAEEIDVVGVVQEVFHRRRPVGGDTHRDGVETLRSIPSGLSSVLSRKGGSGGTRTAALTRSGP